MSAGRIDFDGINASLLSRSREFLSDLFPEGKIRGHEFYIGDVHGSAGESMAINLNTGVGADFASGETFSDLIAVYAAHHNIGMGEAAKRLSNGAGEAYRAPAAPRQPDAPVAPPERPPSNDMPSCRHIKHGEPSAVYPYRDSQGLLFVVARYDSPQGKEVLPWTWDGKRWRAKGYPKPRPLYGFEHIQAMPQAGVIVVEGEKCVDHLRRMGIQRIAVSACGGVAGIKYADWSALKGRDVLLFPDHDDAGRLAMATAAQELMRAAAARIRVIDHAADDLPDGWDIADTDWTARQLNDWAAKRIKDIDAPVALAEPVTPPQAAQRGKPRTQPDGGPPGGGTQITIPAGAPAFVSWEMLGLTHHNNNPHPNVANVSMVLAGHPAMAGKIWYDEFYERVFQTLFQPEPVQWAEHFDTRLTIWVQQQMRMPKVSTTTVREAVNQHARQTVKNEPREWLSGLVWDGIGRREYLFSDGFGAPHNAYTAAVSRCFMDGLVARTLRPGCKLDNMPVLEGSQGVGKSSGLAVIGGRWFAESHEDITSKDFFQSMQGKMLLEISELHAFSRAEVKRIKGIISCPTDRYRASYGHYVRDWPRRCAFAGTTNTDNWNEDETGARRFWPIRCMDVNLDWLHENREQLFAEAVHAINAGGKWWDVPTAEAQQEQEERRNVDDLEPVVAAYLHGLKSVTTFQVIDHLRAKDLLSDFDKRTQMRVATCIRMAGFVPIRDRDELGNQRRIWKKSRCDDQKLVTLPLGGHENF